MFTQVPNVRAIVAYLRLLKVKVNSSTVNEMLQNHPDWPSLLCYSDALMKLNVPNGAGQISQHAIDELPVPFIACTTYREAPLAIVTQVEDNMVYVMQGRYHRTKTVSKQEFFRTWDGVYLLAERGEESGEPNYARKRQRDLFSGLVPIMAVLLVMATGILLFSENIAGAVPALYTGLVIYFIVSLTGFFLSVLLNWYEIDQNNALLKKVCTGITKGNCGAVLSTKAARITSWLSWSEVGLFYFSGILLTLLLIPPHQLFAACGLLGLLGTMALPYPLFSLFYQWRVVRQWCVLCLGVQALLVIAGVVIWTQGFISGLSPFSLDVVWRILLLFSIPALCWYTLKPGLFRLQEAKNSRREHLRIKYNTEIFQTLLSRQKMVDAPTEGLGIDLGNPSATKRLIKVCNPFCDPCARAHPEIDKLLDNHSDLQVKIIFTTPNISGSPAQQAVSHLLTIAESGNESDIKKALDDWYLADVKNYELFAAKHPFLDEQLVQGQKLESMHAWCRTMDVLATPTFFLNGFQLPEAYGVEDLSYFLLD